MSAKDNLLIKVLEEKKEYSTHYWPDLFTPVLSSDEALRNQQASGIKTSMLFPVIVNEKAIGVLIFSMVKDPEEVSQDERDLIKGFTDVVGLAVKNARLYSDLETTSEQLKTANERLKELDMLKDEFVSVASHELRTPMTAIKSYLWMALAGKGGNLTDKQKYYLDRAYNSTDRLIKLVNDMLNVSRIEAGRVSLEVKKVDMNQLVEDIIFEVKPRADELGLKVIEQKVPDLPAVIADSDKIKEVLINLIGNSLKFTPVGGSITITFEQKDGMVITHVTDTGKGVDKDDQEKLFQKFGLLKGSYTTNQQVSQGTGLGLYICKSIMKLHKGDIWAFSEGRDKGSVFSFSLKVYDDAVAAEITKEQAGKEGIEIIHNTI
jgi:signal transduction histidine kinase